ncbi:mRNA triphosphatase CET1 [Mollisia scopiformis]|uniref:mRNA-capping enzyme subunit beta n=1 Tax=Mollisia scopiformis TaxID=149040 RepID=A0A132BAX8_MOLSC|nr:mRNA triphosphatase CET1 [Mollisia scopiformis]KUJ09572.1 mRNA triphosphatase CET1 [Mollisia scopiformis]
MIPQTENGYNSSKRKIEDRNAAIEEPRRVGEREAKPQTNGDSKVVSSSPQPPPKKRIRYTEPPIWARSVRSKAPLSMSTKTNLKANGKLPLGIYPANQGPPPIKTEMNGNNQLPAPSIRVAPLPNTVKEDPSVILGPWEQSITNTRPQDDISKLVADFLYSHVVSRNDLGELASRGVDIEIEAKLGQIIDKDTNERYILPIDSECVLRANTGLTFRSSMTETQHRTLNEFLNKRVQESYAPNPLPDSKERVKIIYNHRRERDTFYELPQTMYSSLPAAVREQLNSRQRIRVRISHDQKTGQVLAKIIKCRVANLDIYMPKQALDCRISINFEMKFDMDVEDIIAASTSDRQPDRNKDRLSYTQSVYQFDLTQVTQTSNIQAMKEHELEIEVSTAAVREQGQKAAAGSTNEYLALVEGLVSNVRVLARATPFQ